MGTFLAAVMISVFVGALMAALYQAIFFALHRPKTKKQMLLCGAITAWLMACVTCTTAASSSEAAAQGNIDGLQAQVEATQQQVEEYQNQLSELQEKYDSLNAEYEQYKTEMQPYEAQRDAEEAERQAALEAEAALGYETGITYENIARDPDEYKGRKVKFYGRIVQIIEGTAVQAWRVAVNDDYNSVIYCVYIPEEGASRFLEDDYVTLYGTAQGLESYQSALGATITIPKVIIDKVEMG